jgi:hypothetical protein
MPQKGTEKRRSSEKMISTDKAVLLWMYCKEIAPFETPTFSKNVGELIARVTSSLRNAQPDAPKRVALVRQLRRRKAQGWSTIPARHPARHLQRTRSAVLGGFDQLDAQ